MSIRFLSALYGNRTPQAAGMPIIIGFRISLENPLVSSPLFRRKGIRADFKLERKTNLDTGRNLP